MKPLSLTSFNGVIFDLDGTLVDSVPDLSLAVNHALSALELACVSEDQVRLWVGNGSRKLIERCLHSQDNFDPEILTSLHGQFLQSYQQFLSEKSVLYPGVLDLLQSLRGHNMPMGLVTNKPMAFVPPLLTALGIADFFNVLVGGDSLPQKKPSAEPLLYVADQLALKVQDCLMVGDSSSDVLAAQAANMPCVLLKQGYNQGQDLSLFNADWLLADAVELKAYL